MRFYGLSFLYILLQRQSLLFGETVVDVILVHDNDVAELLGVINLGRVREGSDEVAPVA